MPFAKLRSAISRLAAFVKCDRGNVAMLFGLTLVPLTLTAGTGLDLARAMMVRSQISEALDAAALAVGGAQGKTTTELQALAQQYFNANYKADSSYGTPTAVKVAVVGQSVTVTSDVTMPTTLLNAIGVPNIAIKESSKVVWGQQKLWVALVLDNTGSMSEEDWTGTSKMDALIPATHDLLDMLEDASATAGDVKVAIVPFNVTVNVDKKNKDAAWIDWTMWEQAPANYADTSTSTEWKYYGPKGKRNYCPWTTSNNGFKCQKNSSNGSSTYDSDDKISDGKFCPTVDNGGKNSGWEDRYYNGCFTSTKKSSGCDDDCEYTHTWVPNNHNTWGGCIADRNQNYDTMNTAPTTGGSSGNKFIAENSNSNRCIETAMTQGLIYNWTTLNDLVDDMTPGGSTNQTVGLAWGWQLLTQGDPFSPGTLPADTKRIIILLSDGLNTRNRWNGNGSSQSDDVDDRMALACTNAKADGVTIYTVLVMSGNSSVLQGCASDSTKYFALTSGSQIANAFTQIGTQITQLRVAQ